MAARLRVALVPSGLFRFAGPRDPPRRVPAREERARRRLPGVYTRALQEGQCGPWTSPTLRYPRAMAAPSTTRPNPTCGKVDLVSRFIMPSIAREGTLHTAQTCFESSRLSTPPTASQVAMDEWLPDTLLTIQFHKGPIDILNSWGATAVEVGENSAVFKLDHDPPGKDNSFGFLGGGNAGYSTKFVCTSPPPAPPSAPAPCAEDWKSCSDSPGHCCANEFYKCYKRPPGRNFAMCRPRKPNCKDDGDWLCPGWWLPHADSSPPPPSPPTPVTSPPPPLVSQPTPSLSLKARASPPPPSSLPSSLQQSSAASPQTDSTGAPSVSGPAVSTASMDWEDFISGALGILGLGAAAVMFCLMRQQQLAGSKRVKSSQKGKRGKHKKIPKSELKVASSSESLSSYDDRDDEHELTPVGDPKGGRHTVKC